MSNNSISKVKIGSTEYVIDAQEAGKLTTDAGSATNPVYFANGVPVPTTYTLGKSVPSNAVFTDTHNSHAIISGKKADGTTDIKGSAASGDITLGDSGVTAGEYGPTANATPGYGSTFNVPDIKVNSKGIVTSITNRTVKIPASDNSETTLSITNKSSTDTTDLVYALTNLVEGGTKGHSITPTYTGLPTKAYVDNLAAGKADLDDSGKVPASQLPSYVDDVIEGTYASSTSFKNSSGTAITGETGKIYVDTSTNKTYRWSGSAFTEISASLALGETSSTAYRGDRGKTAYEHSQTTHAPANAEKNQNAFSNIAVSGQTTVAADTATDTLNLVAGSNVTITTDATNDKITIAATNTTYSAATSSAAGLMSASDKSKLDGIATGANKITVDSTLSSSSTNPVQNKVVNAAISNLNTLVGDTAVSEQIDTAMDAAITGLSVSGKTITYTKGDGTTGTITTQDTNTTYSNFVKSGSGAKAGLVPAPSTTAGTTKYLREDGTWSVPPDNNTTYSNMTAATSSAAGKAGLVPAPGAGKQTSFLRGDGTWVVPTNTTYSAATTSAAGLMSADDKKKLDGIATGANKITVDSALSSTSTNPVQNKVINSALAGKSGTSHTHTVSHTPAGTVSTPTITVTPNTTTVNSITAVGSLPSLTYTEGTASKISSWSAGSGSFSATVSSSGPNRVVTLSHGHTTPTLSYTSVNADDITAWSAGTLPTKGSNTTVVTSIKSATSTQPTFTGTKADLTTSAANT